MKKLLLVPSLFVAMGAAKAQLALQNFNAAGLPAGWVTINDGKTISPTLVASLVSSLGANGWTKWPKTTTDSLMISTSLFSPAGTADRWLITPSFMVPSATTAISFIDAQMYAPTAGKSDLIEIWVSPTAGSTKADFTTKIGTITPTGYYITDKVSLAAYNGQTIRVAFREVGNDAGVVGIDDVQTTTFTPAVDLELTSISPLAGDYNSFATVGGNITISGVAKNNNAVALASFKINYKVGTGATVSQTITPSAPFLGSYAFSFSTPIAAPSAHTDVKVWVETAGDTKASNDTLNTKVGGYTSKPAKKVFMEEATGTWCGWCPRGLVYMDSVYHKYPTGVVVAAVHNSSSDPMTVTAYDNYISSIVSGYPNMVVDRMYQADPSASLSYYTQMSGNYGLAKIDVTPTMSGSNLTVTAKVTPTANLSADYRLMLVLTEDRVHGTASGYAQNNYYSGYSVVMKNSEYNFNTLPGSVPASTMYYDFVARGVYPGPTGATGSLPATMTAGTSYTYTFPTVTLSSAWKVSKMKAIVVLLNATSGTVTSALNAESATIPNSVSEVASNVSGMSVYPSPAQDMVTAEFELTSKSSVTIQVIDMMGKVVKTLPTQELTAGSYQVPTSVNEFANGIYTLKITTGEGSMTQRFSVAK